MTNREHSTQSHMVNNWLVNCGIITPQYLEEIRYRIAVKFKCLKNIEMECDLNKKKLEVLIKMKRIRGLFTNRKKLKNKILINLIEFLPEYKIEVYWEENK